MGGWPVQARFWLGGGSIKTIKGWMIRFSSSQLSRFNKDGAKAWESCDEARHNRIH